MTKCVNRTEFVLNCIFRDLKIVSKFGFRIRLLLNLCYLREIFRLRPRLRRAKVNADFPPGFTFC